MLWRCFDDKTDSRCTCICGTITLNRLRIMEDIGMALSRKKAVFRYNIQEVWDIVTSLEKYQWRSDLSKIEIIDEKQFIEYTKDGYATTFTTTIIEPLGRWEFDMENSNMKGHWTGIFTSKGDKETEVDFIEDVTEKK